MDQYWLLYIENRCSTAPMRERPLSLHKLQVYLICTAIEAVDFG
jgi:hypothetical protein